MNDEQDSRSQREELIKGLHTDPSRGLSSEEALERKKRYGENRLEEKKPKTLFQRFLDQLKDVMILILSPYPLGYTA